MPSYLLATKRLLELLVMAIVPSLFISYRRHDSAGYSGRVHDRLQGEFGHNLLFMDVDSIPLGTDFTKVLGEEIAKCDALLAVIGPGWLDARDERAGAPRPWGCRRRAQARRTTPCPR